jgi:prostaglandin-E synthase 1
MDLLGNTAFPVFAVCAAILVLKMIVVGHYTGVTRIRKKAYLNPEDARQFSGSDEYQTSEDPDIERGLRAHRNDLESTLPFLAIGLIYLLMGASPGLATWLFIVFTALRCLFSVFYIRGMQPWRSVSFTVAELCVVVMLVQILYWGISG